MANVWFRVANVANVRLIMANVWLDMGTVANTQLHVTNTELSVVISPNL